MRSFADPALSVKTFARTYCAIEGDALAMTVVSPLFTAIGAIVYPVDPKQKTYYHIAGVMASQLSMLPSQIRPNSA